MQPCSLLMEVHCVPCVQLNKSSSNLSHLHPPKQACRHHSRCLCVSMTGGLTLLHRCTVMHQMDMFACGTGQGVVVWLGAGPAPSVSHPTSPGRASLISCSPTFHPLPSTAWHQQRPPRHLLQQLTHRPLTHQLSLLRQCSTLSRCSANWQPSSCL